MITKSTVCVVLKSFVAVFAGSWTQSCEPACCGSLEHHHPTLGNHEAAFVERSFLRRNQQARNRRRRVPPPPRACGWIRRLMNAATQGRREFAVVRRPVRLSRTHASHEPGFQAVQVQLRPGCPGFLRVHSADARVEIGAMPSVRRGASWKDSARPSNSRNSTLPGSHNSMVDVLLKLHRVPGRPGGLGQGPGQHRKRLRRIPDERRDRSGFKRPLDCLIIHACRMAGDENSSIFKPPAPSDGGRPPRRSPAS